MDFYTLTSQAIKGQRLEKVLARIKDLHAPIKLGGLIICTICESDDAPVEYPCPTMEIIGDH